jgi:hypothetical protein
MKPRRYSTEGSSSSWGTAIYCIIFWWRNAIHLSANLMAMTKQNQTEEKFAVKAKRKIRNFFLWFTAVTVILATVVTLFLVYATYSEGVRAGTVLKISKRGTLFKTYEGQLDLETFGANVNKENLLNQAFMFSVKDEAVIKDLEAFRFLVSGLICGMKRSIWQLSFLGETKYFVTAVERSKAE